MEKKTASDYGLSIKLFSIVTNDSVSELKTLIEDGLNVNAKYRHGYTLAMIAARYSNEKILTKLLYSGAMFSAMNQKEETALMLAAEAGASEAVSTLLLRDCDLYKTDKNGETALIKAIKSGSYSTTRRLLIEGANPNFTRTGFFPLLYAVQTKDIELVKLLVIYGADVKCTGALAYHYAKQNSLLEIADYLEARNPLEISRNHMGLLMEVLQLEQDKGTRQNSDKLDDVQQRIINASSLPEDGLLLKQKETPIAGSLFGFFTRNVHEKKDVDLANVEDKQSSSYCILS